ncbi:hypothetical protein C4572_01670 [Candidatus Parcubacteria bacterium]|nr:MAG: hypothetical protein C4572_01670 [Candidatus Parcubacteria bacterium]
MRKHIAKTKMFFISAVMGAALMIVLGSLFADDLYDLAANNAVFTVKYYGSVTAFNKMEKGGKGSEDELYQRAEMPEKTSGGIPVLLYHGVIKKPDGENILTEDFQEQMFALKKVGWKTIKLEDYRAFLKGEKILPEKSFLLTFDDGRVDSYYPVDHLLKLLDYTAVIFVITEHSFHPKNSFYLTQKEMERMIKSGRWEIEAHTSRGHDLYDISSDGKQGHFYSNKLWIKEADRLETEEEFAGRIDKDFREAKSQLKQRLGIDSRVFAYPFGDYGQTTENFAGAEKIVLEKAKTLFDLSFYQFYEGEGQSYNYPGENIFLSKRISVRPEWTGDQLLEVLERGMAKNLPYQTDFFRNDGWLLSWGRLSLEDNSLILGADINDTGAVATLDGTYLWNNYVFSSEVVLMDGESFSLVVGYKNKDNYAFCSFGPFGAKLEQVLNGERKILAERRGFLDLSGELKPQVALAGGAISCSLGEKLLLIKTIEPEENLGRGGIGFQTWDPENNKSKLQVKNALVEKIN